MNDADNITIRPAAVSDAEQLLRIYSYYVENTAVSFELETPSVGEFAKRIERITEKYPYLCAEKDGRIIGYAYANTFKERAAYDKCVELTIYLDRDERRRGAGKKLYEALEPALAERGITNLYACIGVPAEGDLDYGIDRASEHFHSRMGYTLCGEFHRCGYKFGRYYSMIWMEKIIDSSRTGCRCL